MFSKDISFFQIIWALIIYVAHVIIFPIRLLHSIFNRDKDDISTRPIVIIRRTFNPIIELFRHRGITYMDSLGYISKEIDDCGHYISLNNGITCRRHIC